MKKLSWNDITVQQFQKIHELTKYTDLGDIERIEQVICILFDKTIKQVEEIRISEFNKLAKQCGEIMIGGIPGKPEKYIKVGKNRYAINYDPTKLRTRQYVEILHFSDKPIEHMHLIMASIVEPVNWYGKRLKNESENHEIIASDLLYAPVINVYHSCVFFCKLYVNLIENIKPYLIHEMMRRGAKMEQAKELLNNSQRVMAGFIT